MAAAAKLAHDPELITRLEREALRSPGTYRFRLALLAVAGDLALTTTLIVPLAAPILIGALWAHRPIIYWLAGAAIVFLAWMFRPSFRIEGRELRAAEAPQMFEEMARLRKKLRVPEGMQVHLDDAFNASAAESRGLFGVLGTKRVLTLGVPLLSTLSREQALAIVAHEYGHFSRRHGRLGHWLYRARVGWLVYAHYVDDSDSAFDRAAAWYAKQFVPYFSARCFVHSRRCEYEADADAAHAVGGKAVAEALTRLMVVAPLWDEEFRVEMARWHMEHPEPPGDYYERFARYVSKRPADEIRIALEDALREPSSWEDTHPSLSERLRALGEGPALTQPARSAGEDLLGAAWPAVLREFNDKWAREVEPEWLLEHVRLRHVVRPLLEAGDASAWDLERRLERARALLALDPSRGRAELRELFALHPAHKRLRFFHAAALLDEEDANGVPIMEALAREDPAFRPAVFSYVHAYHQRRGDARQAERWGGWLRQARKSLDEALAALVERIEAAEATVSSLPAATCTAIAAGVRNDPCVDSARLLEGTAQFVFVADRPPVPVLVHVLVLTVKTEEARRRSEDEDRIAHRYQRFLGLLIGPEQAALVRTFFTTEPMPEVYAAMPVLLEVRRPAG